MEVSTDTIITAAIVAAGVVAIAVISYRRRAIQTDSTGRDVLQILTDFKSAYDKDKGREEATDSSPKRGFKFETYCEDILSKMAEAYSDKLEHTRDEIGELAGRKVGDFVVRCGERSVVFEAKAVTSKRLTTIAPIISMWIINKTFESETPAGRWRPLGLPDPLSGRVGNISIRGLPSLPSSSFC